MAKDLRNYDFVVAIDKSGSMAEAGSQPGMSRWKEAQEVTAAIANKASAFDSDGITVVPFANSHKIYENVTQAKVAQVFAENEPNGGTNTAGVLKAIFDSRQGNPKPVIVVVVTDGQPNDEEAVKRVIRDYAATLPDNGEGDTDACGVLFLQVGNDPDATEFLRDLDNNLNAKFDIVDTKTCDEVENMSLVDVLLQALEG